MYFWSWLIIQLNKSYKHTGKFARTGILTLNGHISETVQNFEKFEEIKVQLFFDFESRQVVPKHSKLNISARKKEINPESRDSGIQDK